MVIQTNRTFLGLLIVFITSFSNANQGFNVEVVREPAENLKANIQNRSTYNQRLIMSSSAPEREARTAINEENCRNQDCMQQRNKNQCRIAGEIQNIYLNSFECNYIEVEDFCDKVHRFAETTVSNFTPSQSSFQQSLKQLLKTKVQESKLIENYKKSVLLRTKISDSLSEIIQNDKRCEAIATNYLAKTPQCKQRYAAILTPERVSFISKYCPQGDIDKSLSELQENMQGFSETAQTIANNHKGARELERAMKGYLILVNEHIKSIEPTVKEYKRQRDLATDTDSGAGV